MSNKKRLTNGDMVIVIYTDQVSELQMASQGSSFASNSLLGTSIAKKAISVVANQVKAWLVEDSTSMSLSYGEANGIGETLTQRTGGNFNTRRIVGFGMAGSDAIDLLQSSISTSDSLIRRIGTLTRKFLMSSRVSAYPNR